LSGAAGRVIVAGVSARTGVVCFVGLRAGDPRLRTERAVAGLAGGDVVLRDGDGATAERLVALAREGKRVVRAVEGDPLDAPRVIDEMRAIVRAGVSVEVMPPDQTRLWLEARPLFGKRVLVTRAREQASGAVALLHEVGAEAVVVPTIELRAPNDPAPLERALHDLRAGAYAWVAFTSANGVEGTWRALSMMGHDARAFGSVRIAAIGPATARALESRGLRADAVPSEYRGEGLADEILAAIGPGSAPRRILLARAARARDALPDALRAAGHQVDVVPVYETHPVRGEALERLEGDLASGLVDAVLFTSSSTVDSLCDALGPRAPELLAAARVASIGPVTTATARERGLRVDLTAAEYTLPGLVRALAESYRARPG